MRQSIENENKLKINGVTLLSATEEFKDNSAGRLHRNIMMSFSQYYSDELSEKVTRGIGLSVEQCKFIGGFVPLGFSVDENKRYQVDPLTAPVVQKIFELYVAGYSLRKINEAITEQFGKAYFKNISNSINRILDNVNYTGVYTRGGTEIPNGMPRIISDELFERVKQMRVKKKRSPASTRNEAEYLLTTKIFCGYHGRTPEERVMMVGVGGTSSTGKTHHYYKCSNLIYKKSCVKKTVRKAWIERHIVRLTQDYVLCDVVIDQLADAIVELQKRENTIIPFLQKQLADVDKRLANLVNSIEEGIANATVKQRLDELEAKRVDLEIAIAKEKIEQTPLTKEHIVFWISKFKGGDIESAEYRRTIVDIFVNSIFLYDDKVVITFNWKDGTKTVTLAELECAMSGEGIAVSPQNSLCLAENERSHLGACTPPDFIKSELMPVGDGFGFVRFVE